MKATLSRAGIEFCSVLHQDGPHHGLNALADHWPCRHVDQDGTKQRQRDADAAENEVFPGRLQRFMRTIDADHQHGGQRRHLDRDPHQADVVGDECEVHGEHQCLVHGVIKAHRGRRQAADFDLVPDIARAKHARGEADKSGQHDEHFVEIIYQQIGARFWFDHEQRHGG